jgi:hypothetical protein
VGIPTIIGNQVWRHGWLYPDTTIPPPFLTLNHLGYFNESALWQRALLRVVVYARSENAVGAEMF